MLEEADRLSWLLNWAAAGPLYARAEERFHEQGDLRNELYARVGKLRSQFDQLSFEEISTGLNEVLRNQITQHDPRLKLWCLVNKGYVDLEIDIAAAKADWQAAYNIARELKEERWEVRAWGELGVVAFLQGNTSVAAARVGQSLYTAMSEKDVGGEMRLSDMIGTGLIEIHRYSEAVPFFDRVIKLGAQNPDVGFPFMAYERKAEALLELDRRDEAQRTLEQVLREAEAEDRPGPKMQALILIARDELRSGNETAALLSLESANTIAQKLHFYRMVACAAYDMARLYDSMGDLGRAEASMTLAVESSRRVGDRFFLPRDLTALAALKLRRGDTGAADRLFEQAEDVIDGMLVNMHVSFWKSGLGAAMSDIYVQHLRMLAKAQDVNKAFRVLERVRGRTVTAILQAKIPPEVSAPDTTIEDQISSLQVALMREPRHREREQLLDHLLDYERRLILMQNDSASSRREFPGTPATLSAIQQVLSGDELLLEYVLDEPQAFCIAISKDHASIVPLRAGRKQIEGWSEAYLAAITKEEAAPELERKLYSVLIAGIPGHEGKKALIIAADGALRRLPFEILKDPAGHYLIESRVIAYTPSASVLQVIRSSAPTYDARMLLLGVGDVPYEDSLNSQADRGEMRTRVLRGLYDLAGVRLKSIPETRQEVLSIGNAVGKDAVLLLGPDATESGFKSQPLGEFKVIHIAAHAMAETEIPERAALVLGRSQSSQDDGLLQVREITQMQLHADLVTLSACNTGVGTLQGEAGASTIEEAFLVAGAKSVVASLWAVDDTYTTALMIKFYEHLVAGEEKAAALRHAKLDMLEKYGKDVPPFYWAAFVLTGDGASSIPLRSSSAHH